MPHDGGEIDDILCRHFELLDELERTLKELEVEQRKGYLSMSQARVAMGEGTRLACRCSSTLLLFDRSRMSLIVSLV